METFNFAPTSPRIFKTHYKYYQGFHYLISLIWLKTFTSCTPFLSNEGFDTRVS